MHGPIHIRFRKFIYIFRIFYPNRWLCCQWDQERPPIFLDFHTFSNYVRKSGTAHIWCTCFSLCLKGLIIYGLNHDITKLKVHHFTAYARSLFLIPVSNLYVVTNGCEVLFLKCKRYLSWHGRDKLLQITDNFRCQYLSEYGTALTAGWQRRSGIKPSFQQEGLTHSVSFI